MFIQVWNALTILDIIYKELMHFFSKQTLFYILSNNTALPCKILFIECLLLLKGMNGQMVHLFDVLNYLLSYEQFRVSYF